MGILSTALALFLRIFQVVLLARILTSWFRPRYRTRGNSWFFTIDEILWRATEPLLAPIRNILPGGGMGIDFSPMILWLLLTMVGNYLVNLVARMGL